MESYSKHAIEIPRTIARALEIDKETGTTLWRDALEKEMNVVFQAGYCEVTTTWRDAISKFIEWLGWFPDVSSRY